MKRDIETKQGITMAILSCLLSEARGEAGALSTGQLVERISEAGKRTYQREVASLLVNIQRSGVAPMLEIGKAGRENTYRLSPEYAGATVQQLQRAYLKRLRYTHEDLYLDLHGTPLVTPSESPTTTPSESPQGSHREIIVRNPITRITLWLENMNTEILVKPLSLLPDGRREIIVS